MKNTLLIFQLKRPALIAHTSEALMQHGSSDLAHPPLGIQSLLYLDSECLYCQVHNDAALVDGYSRLGGVGRDQIVVIDEEHCGPQKGEPAEFGIMVIRDGEPTLEIGPWDLVANLVCSPEFSETRAALARRPLERFRIAKFIAEDVLKFSAQGSKGPHSFYVADHLEAIQGWVKELAMCQQQYPQFKVEGKQESFLSPATLSEGPSL